MLSIGEFSKVTGLTVKSLRFYHEEGILLPRGIDRETGYRSYDERQIETARLIAHLRSFEFPIAEIKAIFASADDDEALETLFERQRQRLEERLKHYRDAKRSLEKFLQRERQVLHMSQSIGAIQEKVIPPLLIAGIRTKGKYDDVGQLFARLFRSYFWNVAGPPMMLIFDSEYRENDADFEACVPLKKGKVVKPVEGISLRELPEVRCFTLLHKGPYDQSGLSYSKLFSAIKEKNLSPQTPSREIFLKGPGMLFRGNPLHYVTELQIPVQS